jgi:hypothetical protein
MIGERIRKSCHSDQDLAEIFDRRANACAKAWRDEERTPVETLVQCRR